ISNLSSVRQCQDLETLHLLGRPDDPERGKAVEGVEAQLAQIRALKAAGRYRPALPMAQAALAKASKVNYRPVEAEARFLVGAMREALEAAAAIRGPDHPVQIPTLRNLSLLLAQQGDFRAANEAANRAVKIARDRVGAESPRLAEALDSSGTVLLMERRTAE